jgi:glycosyltransferase involved in cell wall biosynthesis
VPSFTHRYEHALPLEVQRAGYYLERRRVERELRRVNPDFILTQTQTGYPAVRYGDNHDATVILFLRAYELLYDEAYTHRGNRAASKAVNAVFRPINKRFADYCLQHADVLVANSGFVADAYEQWCGRRPEHIIDFVDTDSYRVSETGDAILHVNPCQKKGIDVTLNVARRLPDHRFIVTGTPETAEIEEAMANLENVEHVGYVDDIRNVYRQAKLVVMPSRWPEPLGRIPIEAGISGIPTVAADRGGLPEAVGDGGVLIESYQADAYVDAIQTVLDDYDRYSAAAAQHAATLDVDNQFDRFHTMLEQYGLEVAG